MSTQGRKALSWSISVLVHTILLIIIVRAGIHYALPEGEVSTGIDVVESKGVQTDVVTKSKSIETRPPAKDVPPKFIPYQEPQDVVPAEKTEDVETSDTDADAPAVPVAPKKIVKELPKKQAEEQKTETVSPEQMKAVEETDQPSPIAAPTAEDKGAQAQQVMSPIPNIQPMQTSNAAQSQAAGAQASGAIPAFGTPGAMIDESKLTEMPGNPKPDYPWIARLRREEGTVILRAFIRSDGHVDLPILQQSSGFPVLDRECARAYAKWRYKPGPSGWLIKPFRFVLKEK